MTLKSIVENPETTPGKIFVFFIQSMIILSIITFSIETIPELNESSRRILKIFEVVTVGIFTMEYILRFVVADKKLGFVFSFFGIIDLLAIAPFYLALGIDLRSIRAFRFFRLFKILELSLFSRAINRYRRAFLNAREELILFGIISLIILFLSSLGIYYFESQAQPDKFSSIPQSLWWAIVTLTTVGYGDAYPITVGGKIFTVFVLAVGLGTIAVPSGIIASALSEAKKEEN